MAQYRVDIIFDIQPQPYNELVIVNDQGPWFWRALADTESLSQPGDYHIGPYEFATASSFYGRTIMDYNQVGRWIVALNGATVSLTMTSATVPTIGANTGGMTINIVLLEETLAITAQEVQTNATDPCNLVDVQLTANIVFNEMTRPIPATFADTLVYIVEGVPRQVTTPYTIKNSAGDLSTVTLPTPSFLNEGLLIVQIAGGSVVINDNTFGLTLEYSLDDSTWQSSNSFPGLTNGDYTCYVRDQYNCKTSIDFTINVGEDGTVKIPDPFFFYSDANCLRMAYREQWNDCDILKNDYNTLSCESTDRVVHVEKQRFRTCDVINLQVKNNYDDLEIKTSNDDVLSLVQKSSNLNNKEALDCKVVVLSETTVGVYFIAGQTYNYDTLDPVGVHTLNGTLPGWGVQGNILTIGTFNYEILDTNYNEDLKVEQLVIAALLPADDYIVKAIFNLFDYELFEVAHPILSETEPFNIEISYGGQLRYVSELIYPDDYTLNLLRIQYYMDYNTDMFFATGIQPVIRLQQDLNNAASNREQESYNTDQTTTQIKAKNYRMNTFKFLPVTKQLARQCMTIFSSSNININGIDYRCENIEMESLEESNLYVLTAKMEEKNSGLYRDNSGTSTVSLPNLVTTDNGYIKV